MCSIHYKPIGRQPHKNLLKQHAVVADTVRGLKTGGEKGNKKSNRDGRPLVPLRDGRYLLHVFEGSYELKLLIFCHETVIESIS